MIAARLAAAGLLAAALVALVAVLGGGSEGYVVRAVLDDAAGLRENSDVKVGGVPAGHVRSVDLTDADRALVTMELDDGVDAVGAGATVHVRPVNLLGEKYADLGLGDPARPLPSGSTIPRARTGAAVELDDVLNTLTSDTRAALRILINEAGVAMAGRGTDFNALLEELPPSVDRIDGVLSELAAERRTIRAAIRDADRVLAPIAGRREDLARLVESAQAALAATADRRRDLGETVAAAPGLVGRLRRTLDELDEAAEHLEPTAAGLRASAEPLVEALEALPAFTEDIRPSLKTARRVAPALTALGRRGAPPLRRIEPTAARLRDVAHDLAPVTATFDEGGAFDALLGLVNGWARTIRTSDGLGHVFRLRVQVDEELARGVLQNAGVLAPTPTADDARPEGPASRRRQRPRPERPGAPARETAPATARGPATTILPGPLGETVDGVVSGLVDRVRPDAAATPGGERRPGSGSADLLDFLLGD